MNSIIPFLIFSYTSTITPGPNNIMLMNSATNFGIKPSIPHFLGICFGFPVLFFCIAVALGAIVTEYVWLQTLITILGISYLLYLAWKMIQPTTDVHIGNTAGRKPLTFLQAAAFQWVNPKAWVMSLSVTAIFTIHTNYILNAMILSIAFVCVLVPCGCAWLWLGRQLAKLFTNTTHRHRFNQVMAIGLVASVLIPIFN